MEKENKAENRRKRNRSGDDDDTDCEGSKARRKEVMDIASSSSSAADNPPRREKYDVFISFRGEDTRLGITSHLHAALLQKKFETYIDNRLQR
nr:TMV resistance protein N-like [Malus domestica]